MKNKILFFILAGVLCVCIGGYLSVFFCLYNLMHKGLNLEYNVKSEYVTFLSFDYSGYWLLTLNDKIDETKLKKSGFYVVNDDEQKFDREFMAKKFGLSKNEIQDYVVYEAEPAIAGTEEICKDCIFQLVMNPKSNLLMVSINKF